VEQFLHSPAILRGVKVIKSTIIYSCILHCHKGVRVTTHQLKLVLCGEMQHFLTTPLVSEHMDYIPFDNIKKLTSVLVLQLQELASVLNQQVTEL
jgi:hypothetical protein